MTDFCRWVQSALWSRVRPIIMQGQSMKRTSGVRPTCLSTALLLDFLYWPEPSFAADADCRSDAGIPSGVIAQIDVGHLRKALADAGFTVGGLYLCEIFCNTGGSQHDETSQGVFCTFLLGYLHKAGLWKGFCFYADPYKTHGRGTPANNIDSLVTVINNEAFHSTRLSELWLEQYLFDDHVT